MTRLFRHLLLSSSVLGLALSGAPSSFAQQPPTKLTEPVYRVSKNETAKPSGMAVHALDPALQVARDGLDAMQTIDDYTAVLIKRERINDQLGNYETMFAKVRNRKIKDNQVVVPFSVYLMFMKPTTVKGREVLFVENQNNGKFFAHEAGLKRLAGTLSLEPTSWIAMQGQRYPLTDVGIENLLLKLLERGERDKALGDCEVTFTPGAKVSKRPCTVLQVKHNDHKPQYDFHIAQVFIDDELKVPVRYAAYLWPKSAGAEPEVLEEYTYQDLKINVGLTDEDFNVNNKNYNFHRK